ncbi:MAG: hypothetical protein KGH71_01260 [Candidatus Micrarchaeota archaeon]|nr:hypothetical protein [Candidatus Micrarchaeota archaeon]
MGYKVIEIEKKDQTNALLLLHRKFGPAFPMGARISKVNKNKLFLALPDAVYDVLRKSDIVQRVIGETYTAETIWSNVWDKEAAKETKRK